MIGPRPERVVVLGAGGHAKVIIATLEAAGYEVVAAFDDDQAKRGRALIGVPIKGTLDDFAQSGYERAVIAIGDNSTRSRLAEQFPHAGWVTVIHPRACVHSSVKVGAGTVIFAGAIVQPDTVIGAHVIVNTAATIDHDCLVDDLAHIAPGAHLAGGVRIHRGALLGIGAAVAPLRTVGEWATVGAGAAVVDDIAPGATVVGLPARTRETEPR